MSDDKSNKYIEYAKELGELISLESNVYNKRRLVDELRNELKSNETGDERFGIEFTGHAFKQISERLEELAMDNPIIYESVFNPDEPSESLLKPSNLKSFVITLLSDANKRGNFKKEESKSNKTDDGYEYRYTINMSKWNGEKSLQLIVIVENNYIKTAFFNWV